MASMMAMNAPPPPQQQMQQQAISARPLPLGPRGPQKSGGAGLEEILESAGTERVGLSLGRFVDVVMTTAARSDLPPQQWFIGKVTYTGDARKDSVHLTASLSVTVIEDRFTTVPLFSTAVAVTASSAKFTAKAGAAAFAEKASPARPRLLEALEGQPGTTCCVGVVGQWYCLSAAYAGEYTVQMEMLVPYATPRKTGAQFAVPRASQNEMRFTVPQGDVLIKVDPSLFSNVVAAGEAATTLECLLPPTSSVSINWTEKLAEVKEKAKEGVSATVDQHTLHSIGDGVVHSTSRLSYTVTSGVVSMLMLEVDPRVRVLRAEGVGKGVPIRNWEVERASKYSAFAEPEEEGTPPQAQFLRIWLDNGIETDFAITVETEQTIDPSAAQTKMPNLACVPQCEAHQITRESGYCAIEPKTNVELTETAPPRRIAGIDLSEIPSGSVCRGTGPSLPLLAYKFAAPNYAVFIGTKKHEDAKVLVAAVSRAYYGCTVTAEGKVMYRLVMVVTNTQRQFLRITCGAEAEVWSAFVAGESVRPATDSEHNYVVPLKKSGAPHKSSSSNEEFTVEFTYLASIDPMVQSGELRVVLPSVDLPVSHLFVSVYLPDGFKFSTYRTSLNEVKYFSNSPPQGSTVSSAPQAMQTRNTDDNDRSSSSFGQQKRKAVSKSVGWSKTALGARAQIKSVNVDLPTTSHEAKFEQMLVVATDAAREVRVHYTKLHKSALHRRRTSRCARGCFMWLRCLLCVPCCCPPRYQSL